MRAAAASSEHPLAAHAVGEVAGAVLEQLDGRVDLALVFVEGSYTGAIEDVATALSEILEPSVIVGTTACGVIAQDVEIEDRSAVSLWVATGIEASAIRIEPGRIEPTTGWSTPAGPTLLLADPFSFDATAAIGALVGTERRLVGGFASAAQGPEGNRLLLGTEVYSDGAVGVDLGDVAVATIVSQGCRPVGEPFIVTGVERNVITELGSRPPLERLQAMVSNATEAEREQMAAGLHIGVLIDEQRTEYGHGDFLIRGILGADQEKGALAIGAEVPIGTTLQFHVRDAASASEDLRTRLAGVSGSSALAFTCNGRGNRLFGRPHHDAELVHGLTGSRATAGMFCAGELGPVNGVNHVHGFTTSALVFLD